MKGPDTQIGGVQGEFPETTWSLVLKAKDQSSKEFEKNLDYLISRYWRPVYRYIRVVWKKSNEDAKDLTQEYFATFLEKDYLKPIAPAKGKFRIYVRSTLNHFMIDKKRIEGAKKRGGDKIKIHFDDLEERISYLKTSEKPEDTFDKEWALTVLTDAVAKLKGILTEEGKEVYYKVFEAFNFNSDPTRVPTYSSAGKELGVKESDVGNYLRYTKQLLRKIIRDDIGRYVYNPSEVDDELNYLSSIIR